MQRAWTDPAGVVFFDPAVIEFGVGSAAVAWGIHAVARKRIDRSTMGDVKIGVVVPAAGGQEKVASGVGW